MQFFFAGPAVEPGALVLRDVPEPVEQHDTTVDAEAERLGRLAHHFAGLLVEAAAEVARASRVEREVRQELARRFADAHLTERCRVLCRAHRDVLLERDTNRLLDRDDSRAP